MDIIPQQPLDDEERGSDSDTEAERYGDTIDELKATLFHGWNEHWNIQSRLTVVDGEKILRDPTGTRTRADIDAIYRLKNTGSIGGHNIFSQKILCEYNGNFFDRFVAEPLPRINFIPAVSDGSHWETLAGIAVAGHYTHLVDVIRDSSARFDVWKVVYQFTLSNRRLDNDQNVYEQFMLSTAFRTQFILEPASDEESEDVVILDRHSEHEQGEDDVDLDFEFTSAWDSQQPLDDPRSYIEIIPWDELEPITVAELEKAGIDIFLPYPSTRKSNDDPLAMPKWILWKLPSNKFFDSHTLHVDDEIYQYCIVNNWRFPGHLLNNHVIFALSPLEATEFVTNLKHYWNYWVRVPEL